MIYILYINISYHLITLYLLYIDQTWGQMRVNEYKYVFANKQIHSFKYFESIGYMNTCFMNTNMYS